MIQHLTEQVVCDCYIIKNVRRLAIEHFFNRSWPICTSAMICLTLHPLNNRRSSICPPTSCRRLW